KRADVFVLDLVFAGDLFHHQFGIGVDIQFLAVGVHGEAERCDEGGVFREIVRTRAEVFGNADHARKVHTNSRLAGIPARAAVDVGLQLHATSNGWSRFSGS